MLFSLKAIVIFMKAIKIKSHMWSLRVIYLRQLVAFVLILVGLNFFFHLHISIVGSVLITVFLSLLFRR